MFPYIFVHLLVFVWSTLNIHVLNIRLHISFYQYSLYFLIGVLSFVLHPSSSLVLLQRSEYCRLPGTSLMLCVEACRSNLQRNSPFHFSIVNVAADILCVLMRLIYSFFSLHFTFYATFFRFHFSFLIFKYRVVSFLPYTLWCLRFFYTIYFPPTHIYA